MAKAHLKEKWAKDWQQQVLIDINIIKETSAFYEHQRKLIAIEEDKAVNYHQYNLPISLTYDDSLLYAQPSDTVRVKNFGDRDEEITGDLRFFTLKGMPCLCKEGNPRLTSNCFDKFKQRIRQECIDGIKNPTEYMIYYLDSYLLPTIIKGLRKKYRGIYVYIRGCLDYDIKKKLFTYQPASLQSLAFMRCHFRISAIHKIRCYFKTEKILRYLITTHYQNA